MADSIRSVNDFVLNDEIIDEFELSLSTERFRTYVDAKEGNRAKAVGLYAWNTAVSAAFYGPLQALEVALRNAMDRELTSVYGEAWYDRSETGLDSGCRARVEQAKQRLQDDGQPEVAPRVIASLSFGFWVALLGPGGYMGRNSLPRANYEMSLWRPALRRSFPHAGRLSRGDAHEPLGFLRTFRNRIAHHEPIFNRHLQRDYERILEVLSWINPLKGQWIEAHSRIPDLLASPRDEQNLKF